MKKTFYQFLTLTCFSITLFAQDTVQIQPHWGPECGCGPGYGVYDQRYKALNDKDWQLIINNLDTFLSKDIQVSRDSAYSYDAYNTLMRIRDIEWTTHKEIILKYLNGFVRKILRGDSYLTQSNRNILYRKDGCSFGIGDPTGIPFDCYWVILKIDVKSGIKLINDTWEEIAVNEPFSNNLRSRIIFQLTEHYKNWDVQLLLNKFKKTKLTPKDSLIIEGMKDKYEFATLNNQLKAWEKLLYRSLSKSTSDIMTDQNMWLWMDNMAILKEVFSKVNILIPLELAEKEKDIKLKYSLAFSCCWLINNKYPIKSDENLIKRVDKLVEEVQNQFLTLKKGTHGEIDYLNNAYQALKKWYKQ